MGLAAALSCGERGYDVTVIESAAVGASLLAWGPTRFFSPLGMNVSPRMQQALGLGEPDALLTGPEFVRQVLEPLAARLRVHVGRRVIAVGRQGMTRGDYAGHPVRGERPFRVMLDDEQVLEAELVLDASGVYGNPVALGAGGLPAKGERATSIIRHLGALHEAKLAGRRVLLVGHGHSAATALGLLAQQGARVVWATRVANLRPCTEVASDPLAERERVVSRANELAMKPPEWLKVERRASVEAIDGSTVQLSGGRRVEVDTIVAMCGYRPDHAFLSELALDVSGPTEGAGALMRALANVTDCLARPRVLARDLASGEPNFYLIGSKSYGRARTFLLQTGYDQLETILDGL